MSQWDELLIVTIVLLKLPDHCLLNTPVHSSRNTVHKLCRFILVFQRRNTPVQSDFFLLPVDVFDAGKGADCFWPFFGCKTCHLSILFVACDGGHLLGDQLGQDIWSSNTNRSLPCQLPPPSIQTNHPRAPHVSGHCVTDAECQSGNAFGVESNLSFQF